MRKPTDSSETKEIPILCIPGMYYMELETGKNSGTKTFTKAVFMGLSHNVSLRAWSAFRPIKEYLSKLCEPKDINERSKLGLVEETYSNLVDYTLRICDPLEEIVAHKFPLTSEEKARIEKKRALIYMMGDLNIGKSGGKEIGQFIRTFADRLRTKNFDGYDEVEFRYEGLTSHKIGEGLEDLLTDVDAFNKEQGLKSKARGGHKPKFIISVVHVNDKTDDKSLQEAQDRVHATISKEIKEVKDVELIGPKLTNLTSQTDAKEKIKSPELPTIEEIQKPIKLLEFISTKKNEYFVPFESKVILIYKAPNISLPEENIKISTSDKENFNPLEITQRKSSEGKEGPGEILPRTMYNSARNCAFHYPGFEGDNPPTNPPTKPSSLIEGDIDNLKAPGESQKDFNISPLKIYSDEEQKVNFGDKHVFTKEDSPKKNVRVEVEPVGSGGNIDKNLTLKVTSLYKPGSLDDLDTQKLEFPSYDSINQIVGEEQPVETNKIITKDLKEHEYNKIITGSKRNSENLQDLKIITSSRNNSANPNNSESMMGRQGESTAKESPEKNQYHPGFFTTSTREDLYTINNTSIKNPVQEPTSTIGNFNESRPESTYTKLN